MRSNIIIKIIQLLCVCVCVEFVACNLRLRFEWTLWMRSWIEFH